MPRSSSRVADRALALATELGLDGEIVRALQFRGAARAESGDQRGLEDLWEAIRRGLELGLGEETIVAYGNLAYQLWLRDGPAIARQVWSAASEFSEPHGFAAQAMWSRCGLVEVDFDLGVWDAVLEQTDAIAAWDRAGGGSQIGVLAGIYRARVLIGRALLEEGVASSEEVLPSARAVGLAEFLAPALVVAAEARRRLGDPAASVELLREFADATAEEHGHRAMHLTDAVSTLIAVGEAGEAASLIPMDSRIVTHRHRLGLVTARSLLAAARGDVERAERDLEDLAMRWRSLGSVVEEVRCLIALARSRVALGRPEAAEAASGRAREILTRVGADPADAELDAPA